MGRSLADFQNKEKALREAFSALYQANVTGEPLIYAMRQYEKAKAELNTVMSALEPEFMTFGVAQQVPDVMYLSPSQRNTVTTALHNRETPPKRLLEEARRRGNEARLSRLRDTLGYDPISDALSEPANFGKVGSPHTPLAGQPVRTFEKVVLAKVGTGLTLKQLSEMRASAEEILPVEVDGLVPTTSRHPNRPGSDYGYAKDLQLDYAGQTLTGTLVLERSLSQGLTLDNMKITLTLGPDAPAFLQPRAVLLKISRPKFSEVATFTIGPNPSYTEGEYRIYPRSLIFRAGHYPDHGFSATSADLQKIVTGYKPDSALVNLHHAPQMLVGKLGRVRSLYVNDSNPNELMGAVAIPRWLDDQLEPHERRVSAEFHIDSKRFVGLALTTTPQIKDAALMACFSVPIKGFFARLFGRKEGS